MKKSKPVRWGIVGLGTIARKFAEDVVKMPAAELAAVGSRSKEKAEEFGNEFDAARRYGTYQQVAEDPDVDAVYIATPHPMHAPNSIMCLKAGKAVLCEKPFTVNQDEAAELIAVAREQKKFLMEAMWTRFLPATIQAREWISQGRIGEPRMVQADFSYRTSIEEESRLFDPNYAGGSLLDVGVYCVSYAAMIFGESPQRIAALADIGRTHVDEQAGMVLGYSGGRLALLSSAIRTTSTQEAVIMGTEGMIRLYPRFWAATRATLIIDEKTVEDVSLPYEGWGYSYEASHVGECLREGKLESDVMPLDESLSIMETMDRIREQWGLKYPMDR